jgi:hypothetical protein
MSKFKRRLFDLRYAVAAAALLASCSPTSSEPKSPTPTPPVSVEATVTPGLTVTARPAATEMQPDATEILPRNDTTAPTPVEVARVTLAGALGIDVDLVSLVSEGEWTDEVVGCDLELPAGRAAQLVQGEHKQVMLSAKNKPYEYWVFDSVGGVAMAFACAPDA